MQWPRVKKLKASFRRHTRRKLVKPSTSKGQSREEKTSRCLKRSSRRTWGHSNLIRKMSSASRSTSRTRRARTKSCSWCSIPRRKEQDLLNRFSTSLWRATSQLKTTLTNNKCQDHPLEDRKFADYWTSPIQPVPTIESAWANSSETKGKWRTRLQTIIEPLSLWRCLWPTSSMSSRRTSSRRLQSKASLCPQRTPNSKKLQVKRRRSHCLPRRCQRAGWRRRIRRTLRSFHLKRWRSKRRYQRARRLESLAANPSRLLQSALNRASAQLASSTKMRRLTSRRGSTSSEGGNWLLFYTLNFILA